VAKYLLSGEKATEVTALLCAYSVVISFYDYMLHNLILLSQLPEAKNLLSGEKATDIT
jgi:hypothetical protein